MTTALLTYTTSWDTTKTTTRMGKTIEQIWIGKTSWTPRAYELALQIWTRSAHNHTGQR